MFQAVNLRCEYRENPLGLDDLRPRFSWQLQDTASTQAAYRIQVFCEGMDTPFWDSGKISSRAYHLIPYEGPALKPRSRYYWRVRVWDKKGQDSDYSQKAFWDTGLMTTRAPAGRFIGSSEDTGAILQPPIRLRKQFEIRGEVVSARAYTTALGVYSLSINEKKVTDEVLSPGWTTYNYRLQYQTWDVTDLVHRGENAVGVTLADGWYRGTISRRTHAGGYLGDKLGFWGLLYVRLKNGSEILYATDGSWKADMTGPIRFADYYDGTAYDARLETSGWDEVGYDDAAWKSAAELPMPACRLIGQRDAGVKPMRTLPARQIIHTPKGETVIDFGQNMVGWVRFRVKGPAGHTVTIRHAEVLDRDGNFYTDNYRSAKALIEYTLREGEQTFEPQLTFYGFRYIQLIDWPDEVSLSDFEGVVIHSNLAETSGFECSDERVNQLFRNIQWGQRGNFVDVPTDCPQRDERLGWTGDCEVFARTACTNMDSALMLTEWLKDLACDQRSDGAVTYVVPNVLGEKAAGGAAWGDAAVIVPWTIYQCYGDLQVLRDQYPSMRAWLRYNDGHSTDGVIVDVSGEFGDWLGLDAPSGSYVGATDKSLIASAYHAYSTYLTMRAAEALGYDKDAYELRQAHKSLVRAFRREFITPNGRLAVHTQTAYALTLHFELAEEEHRDRMAAELVQMIKDNDYHLTTGFVGTPYLCLALTECGYHDVAGQLFMQTGYPGWLYPITKGATTMWEHWDGIKPDGSFWSRDMNSYNHYAYGAIGEWMMRALCGIDMTKPGYGELLLHPRPIEGLSFVSGWLMTPAGRVQCDWRITGDEHQVSCQIPVGSTALLILEHADLHQVTESEKLLSEVHGVFRCWQSDDDVMMELRGGKYAFKWQADRAVPGSNC